MIGNSAGDGPRLKRVLVTGATGLLGGRVVSELLDHGYDVIAHGRNKHVLNRLSVESLAGDLTELADVECPVDAVVHCAALSSPWGRWEEFERANVTGTEAVAQFAHNNGAQRLVFVSSPSVYSKAADHLNISEHEIDAANRLNFYIESKIRAEALVTQAHKCGDIPELVIIRPRGLIGAGDPSLAPRLIAVHHKIGIPLFRGGKNLVDLTAVENVALSLRLSLESPQASGKTYNITNADPQPIKKLLDTLFGHLDLKPRYFRANAPTFYLLAWLMEKICGALPRYPEPPLSRYTVTAIAYSQTLDITAAQRDLGYTPRVSLEEALAEFAHSWRTGTAEG